MEKEIMTEAASTVSSIPHLWAIVLAGVCAVAVILIQKYL